MNNISHNALNNLTSTSCRIIDNRIELDGASYETKLTSLLFLSKKALSKKVEKHPLNEFIGAWKGEDIKDMLDLVYSSRSGF